MLKNNKVKYMQQKSPYKFVVFEGIDFSGKDTQIHLLATKLQTFSIMNTISRGLLGSSIRRLLAMEQLPIDNIAMAGIFTSELTIASAEVLNQLKTWNVVANRWYYSTMVYNAETFEEREEIKRMNRFIIKPDIVIYLDLNPKVAMERKMSRTGKNTEVFETEEKLTSVYEKYKIIFENDFKNDQILFINADQSVQEVHDEIMQNIRPLL